MPKNRVLITKGRSMSAPHTSIPPNKLARLIGAPAALTLIDMLIDEDISVDPRLIPGAVRRSQFEIDWASGLMGQSVVVCQEGKKLSEGKAAWLRCGKGPSRDARGRPHRLEGSEPLNRAGQRNPRRNNACALYDHMRRGHSCWYGIKAEGRSAGAHRCFAAGK
jgi:hypothetical protein